MQKILSQILPTGCSAPPRRRHRRFTTHLALCGLASLAAGWIGSANAGEHFYDFNGAAGDPAKTGFTLFGANVPNAWQTNGGSTGVDGDGFLEITPAANNENLGVLFPLDYFTNADNSLTALPLKGFFLEADVRIGNAVGNNGRPADGFSISFASSLDPVAYWGKQGQFRGWGGGDSTAQALEPVSFNFATGQGTMDPAPCDSGTAENGTKTGVSVQFDTWQGNTIIDQNGQTTAGNDNVGWRVHFNGKMIERILSQPPTGPLPASPDPGGADVNGLAVCPPSPNAPSTDPYLQDANAGCTAAVCADTNSIQTGPYYIDDDGLHNGSTSNLCWAHLSVELTTNSPHLLTVIYKGRPLVDHVEITNFAPYVGQLIMGGRTGGANENRDVDNVHIITYPSVQSIVTGISSTSVYLKDFTIAMQNVGPAKISAINSVTLDGVDITANVTKNIGDPNTTVTYIPAAPFASGSSHTVVITWTDPVVGQQSQNIGFSTIPWINVPASAAVASVDQNSKGFLVTPSQVAGGEPNRMYWADEQLLGLHGTNLIDFTTLATQTNNEVNTLGEGGVVDYANSGSAGQFGFNNSWADFGIPAGSLPNDNNAAAAFTAYLYFPTPGIYVMGGNSDDGLRVTFAQNSHDLLGTKVPGLFADTGRGIAAFQNTGALVITNAGYYGFRLLFENGGGGCGVEWYMTQTPAGVTNILINDTFNNPQAIVAYQYSPAAPPYVSYAEPPLDDDQVKPDVDLMWQLTDASTTVNSGSVTVAINGTAASPTISKSGAITTISIPHTPGQPRPAGTNNVALSFKDSANNTYSYNYNFIIGGFTVLSQSTAGTPDTTKPGFNMVMYKVDQEGGNSIPNRWHVAEQVLAGLWGPNVAKTGSTPFAVPGTINYDINFNAGGNNASDGNFTGDLPFPGLDGTGVAQHPLESYAVEFTTWVAFPAEGTYTLGFNSDDGFRTTPGVTKPANYGQLTVLSPASLAGDKLAAWGSNRGDAVGSQPSTPVTGNVVLALDDSTTPTYDCGTITNTAALAGNIALIERGTCTFQSKVDAAAKAGAIAVIIANNRPEVTPTDGWFPIEMTGGPADNIPAVMIDRTNYFALTNALASGAVTVRLNPIDESNTLGEADIGRGASDTLYNVYVPAAGAYPLRTVYWQGGGGGNCEWFSIASDGSHVLLNDTNALALKTYQTATTVVPTNPTISVGRSGSTLTITYTGTLQSSATVNAGYADVSGASSPYTVPSNGGPVLFYRTKK